MSDIKFAIVIATYYRTNKKTKSYLQKSLTSVINQTHTNWDLIIVGDDYTNESELLDLLNEFRNKTQNNIIYIQNKIVERTNVVNKDRLWTCAGATSMNVGLKYARDNNYKYYAHLDDDDWWHTSHLRALANIYVKYPHCIFANTRSTYLASFLPKTVEMQTFPNNMLPTPCGMVHSSISFRLDVEPFYYDTDLNNGLDDPADALMLKKIKNFILDNVCYCSIYVPALTCYHAEEGMAKMTDKE